MRKITDIGKANLFLKEVFLPKQEKQFTVEAASQTEDWRPVDPEKDLELIFSVVKQRKVNPGETISFDGHLFLVSHPVGLALAEASPSSPSFSRS